MVQKRLVLWVVLGWIGCCACSEREQTPPSQSAAASRIPDFDPDAQPAQQPSPPIPSTNPGQATRPTPEQDPEAPAVSEEPEEEPLAEDPVPWPVKGPGWGLVAAGLDEVIRFDWDRARSRLLATKRADLSGVIDLVFLQNRLYATDGNRILELDADLRVVGRAELGETAALASDGKNLYAAADFSLLSFDPDLRPLGRVTLVCDFPKNAHGLQFHGDTAFVLDNIVRPVCVFRVDTSNPSELTILERIMLHASHMHLDFQWIDARAGQWVIVNKSGGRGGSMQAAWAFPLKKGKKPIFEHVLYSKLRRRGKPLKETGQRVVSAIPGSPNLVVLRDRKGLHSLAKVTSRPKRLVIQKLARLYRDESQGLSLTRYARAGRCLFMCQSHGDVQVWALRGKPRRVARQDIKAQLARVRAVVPFGQAEKACGR